MKTSMKIAAAVAVIGAIAIVALTGGVLAYGGQGNMAGWQGHNGGMMDNHNGQTVAQPTGQAGTNTNAQYCSVHHTYCTYNAQTGAWDCPYGCVYHNQAQGSQVQGTQTQGATGQSSGCANHCCW